MYVPTLEGVKVEVHTSASVPLVLAVPGATVSLCTSHVPDPGLLMHCVSATVDQSVTESVCAVSFHVTVTSCPTTGAEGEKVISMDVLTCAMAAPPNSKQKRRTSPAAADKRPNRRP